MTDHPFKPLFWAPRHCKYLEHGLGDHCWMPRRCHPGYVPPWPLCPFCAWPFDDPVMRRVIRWHLGRVARR